VNTTACITGATAGIGLAFAEVLASEGSDLILVARSAERLEVVAQRLREDNAIEVEVLSADLSTASGCAMVMSRLADASRPVDVLVNNAGFGVNDGFIGGSLVEEERLLDVLVRATLRLTHAVLPGMVERGKGSVINVSSVAGWVPSGTYGAAKSWVTVFTEGLAGELAGTGVTATAVCPGFTHTEFHERAQMSVSALPEWVWLDARRVAVEGLAAARSGRVINVPSKRYTSLSLLARHAPRSLLRRASAAPSLRSRTGQQ
jgi:short-subunit dehydrogenase